MMVLLENMQNNTRITCHVSFMCHFFISMFILVILLFESDI